MVGVVAIVEVPVLVEVGGEVTGLAVLAGVWSVVGVAASEPESSGCVGETRGLTLVHAVAARAAATSAARHRKISPGDSVRLTRW